MSDPPGTPPPLGIEAVEWFPEERGNLTVRVTGRWRRRRPAWSGQPMLVVESAGRRHRFPAMPEPPSLTGAGPGTWRLSFAVPAILAPDLGPRAWLQLGTIVVQLPGATVPSGRGAGEGAETASSERSPSGASRPPSSELEIEGLRRRAREAEQAAADLTELVRTIETKLETARLEAERMSGSLTERDSARRAAEQRAHAEQALRRDLVRHLSARAGDGARAREALGELAAAEGRIRELESELRAARRRGDEAEQLAAAAVATRQRVEGQIREVERAASSASGRADPGEADRLRFERDLVARKAETNLRIASEPAVTPLIPTPDLPAPVTPPPPVATLSNDPIPSGQDALVGALRRELEARAGAEAGLRSRLIDAEGRLAARPLLARRTQSALGLIRQELEGLRSALQRERAARAAAENRVAELSRDASGRRERSQQTYQAIAELRETLEALRAAAPPATPPGPDPPAEPAPSDPGPVEPDRFNHARVRLRETIAPQEPADEPGPAPDQATPEAQPGQRTGRPWLAPVLRALARADADGAGRLLLELLPAQQEAFPDPVAYDLVLGEDDGCLRVTAREGDTVVRRADGPRPASEVDFQVFGGPAAIVRLVTAGPLRRLVRRGVARVAGRRDRVTALRSLVDLRLDLADLHRVGVRLEPELTLEVLALAIEPAWTVHERFTLAYSVPGGATAYLLVRDGHRPEVADEAPAGRVTTTISGAPAALAVALSGRRSDQVTVTGDEWPLALLGKWIKRAQSD